MKSQLPFAVAIVAATAIVPTSLAHAKKSWRPLCTAKGQQAYAGCVLRNGKQVAFCMPKGRAQPRGDGTGKKLRVTTLTYVFASQSGRVELIHPKGRSAVFHVSSQRFVRGERFVISFSRGSYTYHYEHGLFGGQDATPKNSFHGMKIFRKKRLVSTLTCRPG